MLYVYMYLGGSLVSLKLYFLYPSLKTGNITDPDEMLYYVAFHLGLQFCKGTCLGFLDLKEFQFYMLMEMSIPVLSSGELL